MQLSATSRAGMSGMSMLMLSVSGSCGGIGEYLIRGRGGVGVGVGLGLGLGYGLGLVGFGEYHQMRRVPDA